MGIARDDVGALIARLLDGQKEALGIDLLGSYLFGSVVAGDFDPGVSDVDTVAVVQADLTAPSSRRWTGST